MSGSEPSGLMHVQFDYPVETLDELHDWYNSEHIPERMSCPGFVTGQRFTAVEGAPRWLALYELGTPAALESAEYRRIRGPAETPWTGRVDLPSRPNFGRTVYELLWSERTDRVIGAAGPPGLFQLRLSEPSPEAETELRALVARPGLQRVRLYQDLDRPGARLYLADLSGIWAIQGTEFRASWVRLVDLLEQQRTEFARAVWARIL